MTGLLEPADVVAFDEPGELDRLADRPAAVGVDRDNPVGPDPVAARGDPRGVRLGRQPADLDLAPGHTGVAEPRHLAAEVGGGIAVLDIGGDGGGRPTLSEPSIEGT